MITGTKTEDLLQALQREGLGVSSFSTTKEGKSFPKIIVLVSSSTHGEALSRAAYQSSRALRVCTVITNKKWSCKIQAEFSKDPIKDLSSGPVFLILEEE